MKPLQNMTIGISGAVSSRQFAPPIHAFLQRLCERILEEGGNIIHGSHPTFTPVLERVLTAYLKQEAPRRAELIVGRNFFPHQSDWDTFLLKHQEFAKVTPVAKLGMDRQDALDLLRTRLAKTADVLICVGGKPHRVDQRIPGVKQEAELVLEHQKPVFLVGAGGGYTRSFYNANYRKDTTKLLNSLSEKENKILGQGTDVWESVDLVMQGLEALAKK